MGIEINSLLITDLQPDPQTLEWLTYDDSLTEKLKQHTGNASIKLLTNDWQDPAWWDYHVLNLRQEKVFRREIMMYSNDKPCWYARTIIPQHCYDIEASFFQRLQQEALHQLIFHEAKVKRVSLSYYPIDKHCIEWHWLPDDLKLNETIIWLRYSEFSFMDQGRFYLCELVFMENILVS